MKQVAEIVWYNCSYHLHPNQDTFVCDHELALKVEIDTISFCDVPLGRKTAGWYDGKTFFLNNITDHSGIYKILDPNINA